jgi:DNA-binding beta-propeller fold protein YncE
MAAVVLVLRDAARMPLGAQLRSVLPAAEFGGQVTDKAFGDGMTMGGRWPKGVVAALAVMLVAWGFQASPTSASEPATFGSTAVGGSASPLHFEYVAQDGKIYVYNLDGALNANRTPPLVDTIDVPSTTDGVRGLVADAAHHVLYISHGGDHSGVSNGKLLKLDLTTDHVIYDVSYSHGIDSFALSPDGTTIYMPEGENSSTGKWYVVNTQTGADTGTTLSCGSGPHNTEISADGSEVFLSPRHSTSVCEYSTATDTLIRKIGPFNNTVRPIDVNSNYVFASTTGYLGFSVGQLSTGRVLFPVPIVGHSGGSTAVSDPSHGVVVSPDNRSVWVINTEYNHVEKFNVSGLPSSRPTQIADIPLVHGMNGLFEHPCAYDCTKSGWLNMSRDGKYVFVGDSGDVIATSTNKIAMYLPALNNTKMMVEVDGTGTPGTTSFKPTWSDDDRT